MTGAVPLIAPVFQARPRPPEFGHFHVHPELFFQLSGYSFFRFPKAELRLSAGELLLVPSLVTHAEIARAAGDRPFLNMVAYAGGRTVSAHLARARAVEKPAADYVESRAWDRARAVFGYLEDACAAAERSGHGELFYQSAGRRMADADRYDALIRALTLSALAEIRVALVEGAAENGGRGAFEVASSPTAGTPLSASRLVDDCRKLVRSSLSDSELSVAQLASWLRCSPDYLSHRFKAVTGESLAGYIVRLRVERAAELLSDTRLTIKELSWACGFSGVSYFIRVFKRRYGKTPAALR